MYPVSYDGRNAINQSSAVRTRVIVHTALQGTGAVPHTSGSVAFDVKQAVRRQASISFPNDPSYWPSDPYSMLSPWGSELELQYGLVLPGGAVEWVPLMFGPITKTPWQIGDAGDIQVTATDRCSYLADDRLDVATSTTGNLTVVQWITNLVRATMPNAVITDLTGNTTKCPVVDLKQDRLAGVIKLAESIGAEFYSDRTGGFVIAPQATLSDRPSFVLEGHRLLTKVTNSADRAGTYNRVRVSGESNDTNGSTSQTPPVFATAQDDDPHSVTFYGGPFGKKTRFYTSSFITTTAQAQSTATALLAKATGRALESEYTSVTDPSIDAGDVGLATVRGVTTTVIADSVTVPFAVTDQQVIKSRTATLPDEGNASG